MAGHQVDVVSNGIDALEELDARLPDLVLADVTMPGLDGLETLDRIRERHGELPVILVTAQDLRPDERRKADAVFAKPIEFEPLLTAISRLVHE